jgi:hypothetical protein
MTGELLIDYRIRRAAVREVLHALVRERGGFITKKEFLEEGQRRTGAADTMVYSALRTSKELYFNRHWVGFASSTKDLMEKMGFKQIVDRVDKNPDGLEFHYVHYERA